MTLEHAILLGIVQGLTEYLPISSTAHLRVIPALLGWDDPGAAFTAIIQLGTLAAILLYFYSDIVSITRGVLDGLRHGKLLETTEARMGWMIVAGTVPVVVLGLLFKHNIETTLRSLYVIAGAMIGLAVVLMLAEWWMCWRQRQGRAKREMTGLGWLDALVVGCAQCVALIPGSSRSGCTITGGLFMGMSRETAARFSFILSLPAVFAAGIFEFIQARHELLATQEHALHLLAATFVSFVVGYVSIAFLLGYLKKHTTWLFIIYRLALGIVLLALLAAGKLKAF
jgi:undecaprenyl-diphosphatase